MAPSGGSPSLGPQAYEVHKFLTITQEDILNWSPQRLRRQCFQFGLIGEAPEGDVATLRTVFLQHWRAAISAAYAAATQATEGDGTGAGSASEDLPRAQGGQDVTPPASPQGPGVPSAPSVPFQDGAFSRPERDSTAVPWDPESFLTVDELDSRAEGLVLTPGRDPYAPPDGGSPKTPDDQSQGVGEDDDRRPRGTPSGPSMARNIFGARPRATPEGSSARHGDETDAAPAGRDNEVSDWMDIETANDGGGPWLCARAPKRRPRDRSPQGTPDQRAEGRPNLGPTPLKVRELPSAPLGARAPRDPATENANGLIGRVNPLAGNDAGGSDERGAADGPTTFGNPANSGARSLPRSRSASPRVGQGDLSGNPEPPAHSVAPPAESDERCGAYERLTKKCWARLVRLSDRPTERELIDLQEKSLHALIKAVGKTYGSKWRKQELARPLLKWLEEHPGQALPLPPGGERIRQRRQARPDSDQQPRMPADAHGGSGGSDGPRRSNLHATGDGAAARTDAGAGQRQAQDDAPMTDAPGNHPTANADASAPSTEQTGGAPPPTPFGRARSPHQAAAALRDSLRTLQATMDAVAELFERARRDEDCSEEDGARVAEMVEYSRATLRGIAAGFAAADLQAAVAQANASARRPTERHSAHEMGGAGGRTYAQAARSGASPPETRTGVPSRPSPSAPWAPERTTLLHPATDRQRQAPTRASEFGAELDRALRSDLELATGPAVELVRRTARGEYAVQFASLAWERLQADRSVTLPSFGQWHRKVADRARPQRNSVVLQGIPKSMTPDQVVRDLLKGNGDRWKALPRPALDDVRVERLNRRVPALAPVGSGQDSRPRAQWLPSATVRVFASIALCTAILEEGGAVVGYYFRPARPYERAPLRCYRCGEMGYHVAKFCRNKPRCRRCGKGHETSHCPNRPQPQRQETSAGGPPRGTAPLL